MTKKKKQNPKKYEKIDRNMRKMRKLKGIYAQIYIKKYNKKSN